MRIRHQGDDGEWHEESSRRLVLCFDDGTEMLVAVQTAHPEDAPESMQGRAFPGQESVFIATAGDPAKEGLKTGFGLEGPAISIRSTPDGEHENAV